MSPVEAIVLVDFRSSAMQCVCLAHAYGNATDHPDRVHRHPSNTTDAERVAVGSLLPVPTWLQERGGRPEDYRQRHLGDEIHYLVAGEISWQTTPADSPVWSRVYAFFRRWREHELITEFHDRLRGKVREREGREAEPTTRVIDARSVRTAATAPTASRDCDGGKKVPGRKRRIATSPSSRPTAATPPISAKSLALKQT